MVTLSRRTAKGQGQVLVLVTLMMTLLLALSAVVVDGGYAFSQRRSSQNAADLAALAAVKELNIAGATDAKVQAVITATVQANGATVAYGPANNGPRYFDVAGAPLGYVGSGLPAGNPVAVTVPVSATWRPFIAGVVGFGPWKASAVATARGKNNQPVAGGIFPVGIAVASFDASTAGHMTLCPPENEAGTGPGECPPMAFTDGTNNEPGGKSWLKFGAVDKCAGFGLGMSTTSGCDTSNVFLQDEIGDNGPSGNEPPGSTFGCCTAVGLGGLDRIGSLTGNKNVDCEYYVDNHVIVTVPVWDSSGGSGANAWYHIVGFAGFEMTRCNKGKNVEGVWRSGISTSPDVTPPFSGTPLTIELLK
jgi:hypothetical protein